MHDNPCDPSDKESPQENIKSVHTANYKELESRYILCITVNSLWKIQPTQKGRSHPLRVILRISPMNGTITDAKARVSLVVKG